MRIGRRHSPAVAAEMIELNAVLRTHFRSSVFSSRCARCGESWSCTAREAAIARLRELASRPVQGSEATR